MSGKIGFWTDKRVAELCRRWERGESGGVIADAIGCNRNAVLGKLNRLGLLKQGRPTIANKHDGSQQRERMLRLWATPKHRRKMSRFMRE